MSFCTFCGRKLSELARYCPRCGTQAVRTGDPVSASRLADDSTPSSAGGAGPRRPTAVPEFDVSARNERRMEQILMVFCAVVTLLGFIGAVRGVI